MDIKLHKQATTRPKIRAEIQAAPALIPDMVLAERFGVSDMTIRPGHPQTNGMVERFNGSISDVLATRRYESRKDLEQTLKRCCWLYNHCMQAESIYHQPSTQFDE
ncbi:hypothetical protein HCU01_03830 [Halomonas cupida]|uniref:Integrase core domain-containing protein n=1 Tax=Halomonas cupida TaxID=44933 RepID=A0A1M7AD43_9GAMM|nr:hypothetical protein HCU01_03830 [Halomonas cupida]SHL40610.1 Integrase core domain-containing protein [Halomonas cupida]